MTNIVELDSSIKKNRQSPSSEILYVYYPVTVVPVKYWAVEKNELSIIAQTILKLGKLKDFTMIEILKKMNIPPNWSEIIQYEVNELVSKGLLAQENNLFYKTISEGEPTKTVYKEGFMFFDEVRGQFFEYVHETDLFFSFEEKVDFIIERNTMCTKTYYESAKCEEQIKLAVFNFNEMKKKYFDEGEQGEEMAVENAVSNEIRVEKKAFAFVKTAYLPISLGLSYPLFSSDGDQYVKVEFISPFTKEPSLMLKEIIENQPIGKMAIEWHLDSSLSILEQQMLGNQSSNSILDRIEESLNGTRVSTAVLEYLQLGEQVIIEYETGEHHNPAARAAALNNYNLAIEAVMQELIEDKRNLEVPEEWCREHQNASLSKMIEAKFYEMCHVIPYKIMNNMKKIARNMVEYNGLHNVNIYGNRDYMAVLLLHDLLKGQTWRNKIMANPQIIQDFEELVATRNEMGGHHDGALFQMGAQDYYKLLEALRKKAYTIIQFLEEK